MSSFGIRNVVGGFSTDLAPDHEIPYVLARTASEHLQLARMFSSLSKRGSAVDLGCGYGRNLPILSQYFDSVVGIERDQELGLIASRLCTESASVLLVDALFNTEQPADSVDLILTYTVLQHLNDEEMEKTAKEMIHILTPCGAIILVEETAKECAHPPRTSGGHGTYPRSEERYAEYFGMYVHSAPRATAPGGMGGGTGKLMLFLPKGSPNGFHQRDA